MSKKTEDLPESGFISRWSRKKLDSEGQEDPESQGQVMEDTAQALPVESGEADDVPATAEPEPAEPVLTDDDMPPIESLTEDSDYSGFMSPGVSQEVRRVALRKLFASAGFNIRDGLDDYDEDFRNFAPLGDIVTCDMKHQIEMAELRKREAEQERLAQGQEPQEDQEMLADGEELEDDAQRDENETLAYDEKEAVQLVDEVNEDDASADESIDAPGGKA